MLVNKKVAVILFSVAIIASFLFSNLYVYGLGAEKGYFSALTDMKDELDIEFSWIKNSDGSYTVSMWRNNGQGADAHVQVDCYTELQRDGSIIEATRRAGTLTTIGKNWIEDQLGDSPSTDPAKWISVDDTDATGLSVASTKLTSELATAGLTRAAATYTSTGNGVWTESKAFSVTDTVSAQTYGLQWAVTAESDNNLLCYDTSTVKNCINGDTLTVTWTITVT